jgi:hypothetical protein
MALGQRGYLLQVAADQDRVGHSPVTIGERYPTLVADRHDGTDQVLVVPHPSGNAVHDDANPPTRHSSILPFQFLMFVIKDATLEWTTPVFCLSNMVTASLLLQESFDNAIVAASTSPQITCTLV